MIQMLVSLCIPNLSLLWKVLAFKKILSEYCDYDSSNDFLNIRTSINKQHDRNVNYRYSMHPQYHYLTECQYIRQK